MTMLVVAAVVLLGLAGGAAQALELGAGRVRHRDRADGVHPDLQWLLDQWEVEGSHTIVIAGGDDWPYSGGVRVDETSQAAAAGAGLSKASTLQDTPHGRGAALDIWPEGFNPHRGFDDPDQLEGAQQLMHVFGEWAESKGFTWGGRWQRPDEPHVEITNWRDLPFPPPDYRGAS